MRSFSRPLGTALEALCGEVTSRRPPLASLRDRKKEQTRAQLAAATLALTTREGPDYATTERIAAEAGVSTRTFHNYFASKTDAFYYVAEGLADHAVAAIVHNAQSRPDFDAAAAVEAVASAVHAILNQYEDRLDQLDTLVRFIDSLSNEDFQNHNPKMIFLHEILASHLSGDGWPPALLPLKFSRYLLATVFSTCSVALQTYLAEPKSANRSIHTEIDLAFSYIRNGFTKVELSPD